jgi:hypothetical protein
MRGRGLIRRVTAALLATLQLGGCAGIRLNQEGVSWGRWRQPEGIAPADVVTDWHPDFLRVTRTDSTIVELSQPVARGDTVVGWTTVPARKGTFAVDRSEVRALQVRGLGATLTLRDSSIIDIQELWERGDSLGGPGKRRSRRESVAIPLADVARVEVLHIPKSAQRPAAVTGALAVSPGDTIRVFVGDTTAPKGRTVQYRGTFQQLANDSLVLAGKMVSCDCRLRTSNASRCSADHTATLLRAWWWASSSAEPVPPLSAPATSHRRPAHTSVTGGIRAWRSSSKGEWRSSAASSSAPWLVRGAAPRGGTQSRCRRCSATDGVGTA